MSWLGRAAKDRSPVAGEIVDTYSHNGHPQMPVFFVYCRMLGMGSMNRAEIIKGQPHDHAQPRLLLGCGMLSLAGLGLPLASKGSYGVSILMLADYYRLSSSNALPLVLGILAPLTVCLAIRAARGRFENAAAWCVALGLSGLAISSLGYFEGVHHIRIFGSSCMPQARENDPLAEAGMGWGAVLHMVAYAAMTAWGMQRVLRPAPGACQATAWASANQ